MWMQVWNSYSMNQMCLHLVPTRHILSGKDFDHALKTIVMIDDLNSLCIGVLQTRVIYQLN